MKIGKDVTNKKATAIISTPKEHEEFEKWKEEQLEEREEKPKKQAVIKSKMPEEPEPSDDVLARERAKELEEMARAKAEGKLNEHFRSKPLRKKESEEEIEEEEDIF